MQVLGVLSGCFWEKSYAITTVLCCGVFKTTKLCGQQDSYCTSKITWHISNFNNVANNHNPNLIVLMFHSFFITSNFQKLNEKAVSKMNTSQHCSSTVSILKPFLKHSINQYQIMFLFLQMAFSQHVEIFQKHKKPEIKLKIIVSFELKLFEKIHKFSW